MRRTAETLKPCILATLESISPLPLLYRDEKRVADWNMVHWDSLSGSSDYIMRLAITILEVDADDLSKELFSKDEGNWAKVGIDIILARPECLNQEAKTRLNEAIKLYLHHIYPSPDQYSGSLLMDTRTTTDDLSTAKKIADEFLSRHGMATGKRAAIKTPYVVRFADQVAQLSGSYGPKPIPQAVPRDVRSILGEVDALCLSDRSLGILLEKGKKMGVAFDEVTQFIELKHRLGNQKWYEFLIKDEVDAKGRIVSHLVSIGDEASRPSPLFL